MIEWREYLLWIAALSIIWLWSMYYEHIKKSVRSVLVRLGILRDRPRVRLTQRPRPANRNARPTDVEGG